MNWCKSTEEGREWVVKNTLPKAKKAIKKESDKKFVKMKAESTNWLQKIQTEVQTIVRLIDYGQPCTARGNNTGQMQGGHVAAKGGHPQCRLNLHNIHIQCVYSNKWKNDDGLMLEGIERIYGKEYRSFVESLVRAPITKHTNWEYHEMYIIAKRISNELKKDKHKRDPLERLNLRNKYNQELGCYDDELAIFNY